MKFDALADAFFRDTGVMAPGKDQAGAAHDGYTDEERLQLWKEWLARKEGGSGDHES